MICVEIRFGDLLKSVKRSAFIGIDSQNEESRTQEAQCPGVLN
jgi:hypothetical protein